MVSSAIKTQYKKTDLIIIIIPDCLQILIRLTCANITVLKLIIDSVRGTGFIQLQGLLLFIKSFNRIFFPNVHI
jgi:hypothetical protein